MQITNTRLLSCTCFAGVAKAIFKLPGIGHAIRGVTVRVMKRLLEDMYGVVHEVRTALGEWVGGRGATYAPPLPCLTHGYARQRPHSGSPHSSIGTPGTSLEPLCRYAEKVLAQARV